MADRIKVTISPDRIRVTPGKRATTLATIGNVGDVVDTYSIAVEGPEAGWCTVSAWTLSVAPGEEAHIELAFTVPEDGEYTPGHYDVVLKVVSKNDPTVEATGRLVVQVEGVVQFDAQLVSVKSGGGGGTYQLTIVNSGNLKAACTVVGEDPQGKLKFEFERATTIVDPGGSATIGVVVSPRRRPITGRPGGCDFRVVVSGAGSGADEQRVVRVDGSVTWMPILTRRALVGLAVLSAVVLSAVLIPLLTGSGDSEAPGMATSISPLMPFTDQEVTFTATSDADDLAKIEIFIDGVMQEECDSSPCEYVGGPYAAGDISYKAVVWDEAGNKREGMAQSIVVSPGAVPTPVDSVRPTVSIVGEMDGDLLTLTAEASDEGGVESISVSVKVGDGDWEVVQESEGSTSTYSGGPYPEGLVYYRAEAVDMGGNVGFSAASSMEVQDTTAPVVELIISPQVATTSDVVTFTARASDTNGIVKIEIYSGTGSQIKICEGLLLGTDGEWITCSRTWGPFGVGEQDFWAWAWDSADPVPNRGNSGRVTLTVVE